MPFTITSGAPDIPDGQYEALLESVTEDQGQYGTFRKWGWLVTVNGKTESLTTRTTANTGPGTDSYKYLEALTGQKPAVGETIPDPIGNRVLLTLQKADNGWPRIKGIAPYSEPQQVMPGVPR